MVVCSHGVRAGGGAGGRRRRPRRRLGTAARLLEHVHLRLDCHGGRGLGLFIIQRTHGVALYNESLGQFSVWLWNLANAGGVGGLTMGMASSGPFPGYVWPMQLLWLLGLLLLRSMSRANVDALREPMFASTGYFLAALTWGAAVYFAGNGLWLPDGFGINPGRRCSRACMHRVSSGCGPCLWERRALYAATVAGGRPLYSRRLAHIGLWGLALHAAAGVQRLWGAAVPDWVQAASIGAGVLTIVAVLAVFVNVTKTVGDGERAAAVYATPSGRALRLGTWLLLATGVLAALQPLTVVQQFIHGTQWAVAQHLTALLSALLLMFAGVYELLPMLRQPKDRPDEILYSPRVAHWHVTLSGLGAALVTVGLWLGGTLQVLARNASGFGSDWAAAAAPGLVLQAAGLGLLLAAQLLLVITVVRAATARQPVKLPVIVTNPGTE